MGGGVISVATLGGLSLGFLLMIFNFSKTKNKHLISAPTLYDRRDFCHRDATNSFNLTAFILPEVAALLLKVN